MRTTIPALAIALACTAAAGPAAADDGRVDPFIVNGSQTTIAEFPAYAQLHVRAPGLSRAESFVCGGTVVADRLVLTAAHCTFTPDLDVIVSSDRLTSGGQRVRVQQVMRHPGFDDSTLRNDLALLKLEHAVDVDEFAVVGPTSDHRWQGGDDTLTVIGLGCTEPVRDTCADEGASPVLRRAEVGSRLDSDCANQVSIPQLYDAGSMLCAGDLSDPFGSHGAPGACFGDSGGPLLAPGHRGEPVIVGTVSWGASDCGDYPVVYGRVAAFRSWLRDHGVPVDRDPFDDGPALSINGSYTPLAGDFNGDGNDDAFYYGPGAGSDLVRLSNGNGTFRTGPNAGISGVYQPAVGDFNGDGRDDILWYRPGSQTDMIRLGNASGGFAPGPAIDIDGTFTLVPGDFNGDGRGDMLFYGPGSAPDLVRLGTPAGKFSSGPPISVSGTFDRAVPGDYDGDGNDDILWYDAGSPGDLMRLGTDDGSFRSGPSINIPGTFTPIAGDFSGNGRVDVVWYAPGSDGDLLREATASATFTTGPEVVVNASGYEPFAGDFDGDGAGDIIWYRRGTASDALWLGNCARA